MSALVVVGFELVRCEPLGASLTRSTCARRWVLANKQHSAKFGSDAIERARYEACAGCTVGRDRVTEAELRQPKESAARPKTGKRTRR